MFRNGKYVSSFAEFERFTLGCKKVFGTWEEEEDRFRTTLRDQMRRYGDEAAATRAFRRGAPDHKILQDRIDELSASPSHLRAFIFLSLSCFVGAQTTLPYTLPPSSPSLQSTSARRTSNCAR